MTEQDVFKALQTYFRSDAGFVLLPQVGNSTGTRHRRTADAVAMQTWPSRGLYLHGIEIKTRRSDWVREMKYPEKAEVIARFCHFWWVAGGTKQIVRPSEIPDSWGYLYLDKNNNVHLGKKAVQQEPATPTHGFMAAVLRQASRVVTPQAEIDDAFKSGVVVGNKEAKDIYAYRLDSAEKAIAEFRKASGIDILREYHLPADIGTAVRVVLDNKHDHVEMRLKALQCSLTSILNDVNTLIGDK